MRSMENTSLSETIVSLCESGNAKVALVVFMEMIFGFWGTPSHYYAAQAYSELSADFTLKYFGGKSERDFTVKALQNLGVGNCEL